MPVGEMLSRMSSREFAEWMAYYRLEPFGDERADLRAGTIAAPLLNMWAAKGSAKAKPSDWIMKFGPREPMDWEAMKSILQAHSDSMKASKGNL